MPANIESARHFAECVRFSADRVRHHSYGDGSRSEQLRDAFFKSGVLVSEQTSPSLAHKFSQLCETLGLPQEHVEAFVYASPEVQAQCYSRSIEQCSVRYSSTLVNLLDDDEFSFVAGHEIGHFLLGHGATPANEDPSIEHFMQMRAQEVSVDRIGLIACGKLQTAIGALMKTVSGLDRRHLRFNVGKFISQLSHVSNSSQGEELANTHPSMIVRCRALLWFSMDNDIRGYPDLIDRSKVDALDKKVVADLAKYVDGPARERIEQTKRDLSMWMAALEIVSDGIFERPEQEKFRDAFGSNMLENIKTYLSGLNRDEVHDAIYERLKASREELESIVPDSFDDVYKAISLKVSEHF